MADQEIGIVLIVLGVVFMLGGFIFAPICGIGLILLIIGIIIMATGPSRASMYAQPGLGYPAPPPYGYPPPTAPGGMAPPPAPYNQPLCPVCSSPLSWVPQYGRWYCNRCQAYR
jgi:hypothetical protein